MKELTVLRAFNGTEIRVVAFGGKWYATTSLQSHERKALCAVFWDTHNGFAAATFAELPAALEAWAAANTSELVYVSDLRVICEALEADARA